MGDRNWRMEEGIDRRIGRERDMSRNGNGKQDDSDIKEEGRNVKKWFSIERREGNVIEREMD